LRIPWGRGEEEHKGRKGQETGRMQRLRLGDFSGERESVVC